MRGYERTTNGQLRTTSDELEVTPACWRVIVGHDLDQITNGTALHIEPMVSLQRLAQGYAILMSI